MSIRTERAHAKINLGLEILGRRPDGYHEIRSVLVAISLHDMLVFEPLVDDADRIVTEPHRDHIPEESNLVTRTLETMRNAGAEIPPQRITITKRIPAAAGLGGASSDAAATIRAFREELDAAHIDVSRLAASVGSDVPFFLDGPVAMAAGRGELLTPLASPDAGWVVLSVPEIQITEKTRTMYGAVDAEWWSDGNHVRAIAERLPALPAFAPFNVFERALLQLYPALDGWRGQVLEAGAPFVALTGAGPAHYTLVSSEGKARTIANHLESADIEAIVARIGTASSEQGDA